MFLDWKLWYQSIKTLLIAIFVWHPLPASPPITLHSLHWRRLRVKRLVSREQIIKTPQYEAVQINVYCTNLSILFNSSKITFDSMEPLFLDTRNQENISQDKNFWFLYFSIQHFFIFCLLYFVVNTSHLTAHTWHSLIFFLSRHQQASPHVAGRDDQDEWTELCMSSKGLKFEILLTTLMNTSSEHEWWPWSLWSSSLPPVGLSLSSLLL